jgi:hypothetical protein
MMRTLALLPLAALLASAPAAAQSSKKKREDEKVRMVHGTVTDAEEKTVAGAVVQLKNAKTLQIRSFITQEHGTYAFHGLDRNVDYTLKADFQGAASPVKTLSVFDDRPKPVINLQLGPKK